MPNRLNAFKKIISSPQSAEGLATWFGNHLKKRVRKIYDLGFITTTGSRAQWSNAAQVGAQCSDSIASVVSVSPIEKTCCSKIDNTGEIYILESAAAGKSSNEATFMACRR